MHLCRWVVPRVLIPCAVNTALRAGQVPGVSALYAPSPVDRPERVHLHVDVHADGGPIYICMYMLYTATATVVSSPRDLIIDRLGGLCLHSLTAAPPMTAALRATV